MFQTLFVDAFSGVCGVGGWGVSDIVGQGFVKLLVYLRKVLLQDAAALMEEFRSHGMWCHDVFVNADFRCYAEAVRDAIHDVPVSVPHSVEAAMHIMTNIVQAGLSSVGDRMTGIEKQIA